MESEPKLNNFGSATLVIIICVVLVPVYIDMTTGITYGTVGAVVRGGKKLALLFAGLATNQQ